MSISNIFKPKFTYQLQRVGKNNDGGYLVGINTIKQSKVLISYGINDDWSFEKKFYKINNKIKIMTFDNKLNFFFLLKKLLNNFFKIFLPSYKSFFFRSVLNIFDYFFFIKNKHEQKKIIIGDTLKIIKKNSLIFFKIDIEGSEYQVLDELIKIKNKITGIVIEFHYPEKNLQKIKSFIRKINLKLTHIHGNNFWGINRKGNPNLLEITFEKNPKIISKKIKFPHALDMPNNPYKKDLTLNFSK
jgi:hypothetical protein